MTLQQSDNSLVLALNVDGKGVHAIVKQGEKTYYRLFNISTGKPDTDSRYNNHYKTLNGLRHTLYIPCATDQ